MNRRPIFLILILIHIGILTAQGQAKETLTILDCKRLVLLNNEESIIASVEIDAKQQSIEESKTEFLPSVSASVMGNAFTDNPILTSFARYSALGSVTVEQPIYLGGKLKTINDLATIEKQIAENKKKLTDEELLYFVEQLYWQVVAVNQQVIVAENYLKTLTDLETKVGDYFKAGIVNKTDLLETQVERNRAQYNLEVASNFKKVAKLQLSNAIGRKDINFDVEENFNTLMINHSLVSDRKFSLNERSEVKILTNAIRAKKKEAHLIKSDYRPQLSLSLSGNYYAGEETDPRVVETEQGFGAAFVNLKIPVFSWGQKKHKLKRNAIEKQQLELNQQRTKKQISVEVQQAIDKVEEAKIKVVLSQKSTQQAQENARITNDNYNAGTVTSEEVLEAEALYQQAQLDYINARVMQQLSYSNYLKTLGKLSNKKQ